MNDDDGPTCETCLYFFRSYPKGDRHQDKGVCRRSPPELIPLVLKVAAKLHHGIPCIHPSDVYEMARRESLAWGQPTVAGDFDWCGEYQPSKNPEAT